MACNDIWAPRPLQADLYVYSLFTVAFFFCRGNGHVVLDFVDLIIDLMALKVGEERMEAHKIRVGAQLDVEKRLELRVCLHSPSQDTWSLGALRSHCS